MFISIDNFICASFCPSKDTNRCLDWLSRILSFLMDMCLNKLFGVSLTTLLLREIFYRIRNTSLWFCLIFWRFVLIRRIRAFHQINLIHHISFDQPFIVRLHSQSFKFKPHFVTNPYLHWFPESTIKTRDSFPLQFKLECSSINTFFTTPNCTLLWFKIGRFADSIEISYNLHNCWC